RTNSIPTMPSTDVSNKLMNIQDSLADFASIDHLGSVWLSGLEMMMELSNKGTGSDEFKKSVDSFTQPIRQNKARDDKRRSDSLRNAGCKFCSALSLAFNDLSKKAPVAKSKNENESRLVQYSPPTKPTRETRPLMKKKVILLKRRIEENVARPVQPLRLLRCGDCPSVFKNNAERESSTEKCSPHF
ncbi:hypothetical protein PRIPAC_85140, partial [Pristionchus pacificus]